MANLHKMNSKKIVFGKISSNFGQNAVNIKPVGTIGKMNDAPKEIEALDDEADSEKSQIKEAIGISSFGKKAKTFDIQEMMEKVKETAKAVTKPIVDETEDSGSNESDDDSEDEFVGPPIPNNLTLQDQEIDSDSDKDDETSPTTIPCSHEAVMTHGSKAVIALSLDASGARLASGSVDYDVSFWDFAGMDTNMSSFRTLQPAENHPIRCLQYSCTGDLLLVISGSSQAKVLDRDGFEKLETVKGDMYITDQARTKGHTAGLLAGGWNPLLKEEFLTTSADGTVRTWDFYTGGKSHKAVIKCRAQNGLKTSPNSVVYNKDGRTIACGCADGSIQVWDHRKSTVAPASQVRRAHDPAEISSIRFSNIGHHLLSRSVDETMKLWDTRNLKQSVNSVGGLFSRYDTTDAIFNPSDNLVATGVSLNKGETTGYVLFYEMNSFKLVKKIPASTSHVIKVSWHPKLNQIFIGTGNGLVKCYYDEKRSLRGATLCASKYHRKAQHSEVMSSQQVLTPHALPLFRQERRKTSKKQMEKDRLDPVKSRRPDLPITSGQGGRVASSGGTLSSYVIRNLGLSKRVNDDQDPREAILKYAKEAEENPYWITPAYAKSQPVPVLAPTDTPEEPPAKKSKPD